MSKATIIKKESIFTDFEKLSKNRKNSRGTKIAENSRDSDHLIGMTKI